MKKVKEEKTKEKNTKKFIIKISILIVLIIGLCIGIFYGYKYYKNKYDYSFKLKVNEITIKLNETINPLDYIKTKDNVDIEYVNVPTNKVGKESIKYIAIDKHNKRHYKYIDVNIIDDIAPKIEGKDKVTIYTGSKLDLKSYVKASDNYDKDLEIKIDGTVDVNKIGEYKVVYTVEDSSGNKAEHIIKFTVKEKVVYVAPTTDNGGSSEVISSGTTSKGYKIESKGGATYIKGILVANKTYALSPSYGGGLTSATKNAFNEMKAAAAEAGYTLRIGSGYRSYKTQTNTYNRYVKRDGQAKADTYSARPGHSEHQTGLAIDICANGYKCIGSGFNGTAPANWLSENAYKYGFILRYPNGKSGETGYKFESWHYRYVGKELAEVLYNGGNWITLESYLGITSKYNY